MKREMAAGFVQFTHPEKVFAYLPGFDDASLAAIYGLDVSSLRAIRGRFEDNARASAQALLAEPGSTGRGLRDTQPPRRERTRAAPALMACRVRAF